MKRQVLSVALVLTYLAFQGTAFAAPWSGIIAPERATDWSGAGARIVERTTICINSFCNTLWNSPPGPLNASVINDAIANAPANSVVRLPAGTFTLESGIQFHKSDVTLRGQGAGTNGTKLIVNDEASGSGLGLGTAIRFTSGAKGSGKGSAQDGLAPSQSATWTAANYNQGQTQITLSNTTGLIAGPVGMGSIIILDQLNDSADGYPAKGDLYVCEDNDAGSNCSNQGGNNWGRLDRSQVQVVTVTALSGNQVSISPGLQAPNWRAARSLGAWWNTTQLRNAGLEDFAMDFTSAGIPAILIKDAVNCWVKGLRLIKTNGVGGEMYHFWLLNSAHITMRSNYLYGPTVTNTSQYGLNDNVVSDNVFENNIFHHNVGAMVPNDPGSGNVYAYNYVDGAFGFGGGIQFHSGTAMMALVEGNNMVNLMGDVIHGVHYFVTAFRNHFDKNTHNDDVTSDYPFQLNTNNRFFNLIGNVSGHANFTPYEAFGFPFHIVPVYLLNWAGNGSGTTLADDPHVSRTLMRWGNWDSVTAETHPNGRFMTTEVPSTIANYANAVPANQSLPASFYLPSEPSWWKPGVDATWTKPKWPAIGPDVSGGNVSTSPTGGHADKIPARLCFEHLTDDPAYPLSSPRIKTFNAATCYASETTSTLPKAPTNFKVVT